MRNDPPQPEMGRGEVGQAKEREQGNRDNTAFWVKEHFPRERAVS